MSAEKYLPMQSSESLALGLIKGNTNGGLVPTFLYLKSEESKVEQRQFFSKIFSADLFQNIGWGARAQVDFKNCQEWTIERHELTRGRGCWRNHWEEKIVILSHYTPLPENAQPQKLCTANFSSGTLLKHL